MLRALLAGYIIAYLVLHLLANLPGYVVALLPLHFGANVPGDVHARLLLLLLRLLCAHFAGNLGADFTGNLVALFPLNLVANCVWHLFANIFLYWRTFLAIDGIALSAWHIKAVLPLNVFAVDDFFLLGNIGALFAWNVLTLFQ